MTQFSPASPPDNCRRSRPDRSLRAYLGLFIFLPLLFAACSKGVVKPAGDDIAVRTLERLRAQWAATPRITAVGEMNISGVPVTVRFDAIVAGRDSLRVNLTGPFSMNLGALTATPTEFTFFNVQEGEVVEGVPSRETFRQQVQLDLDYSELVAMFRGEIPRLPELGEFTAELRGEEITYTVPRPGGAKEIFTIDTSDLSVPIYRREHGTGQDSTVEIEIESRTFMALGQRRFPHNVMVRINNSERTVAITIEKVKAEIDPNRLFHLNIPPDIPRRRL